VCTMILGYGTFRFAYTFMYIHINLHTLSVFTCIRTSVQLLLLSFVEYNSSDV